MVDVFAFLKRSPEHHLRNETVLANLSTFDG